MSDDHPLDIERIERFVAPRGPSGDERAVADVFEHAIKPHVDAVSRDELGNVIATSEGIGPEIMVAAHTDELGFLVDGITDAGFLRFRMLGGHYKGNLAGQGVLVGPDRVPGVVGAKSRHYMTDEEKESLPENLHIDVGARNGDEVADLNVRPGDFATFDRDVTALANGRLAGRAIDDRIALAILVAVAERTDADATIHYVATVQEEVGLRGARAAGFSVDPDVGIAVEIFPADDYPSGGNHVDVELDAGPVVELGDGTSEYMFGGLLVDRRTLAWLTDASDVADVEVQHAVMLGGTTDATQVQGVRGGRHAGAIAVPCRYTHSPVETVSLADARETVDVLCAALVTPFPSAEDARRRPSEGGDA